MTAQSTDFRTLERKSRRKAAWLVAVFIVLFTALGLALDFVVGNMRRTVRSRGTLTIVQIKGSPTLAIAALIISFVTRRAIRRALMTPPSTDLTAPSTDFRVLQRRNRGETIRLVLEFIFLFTALGFDFHLSGTALIIAIIATSQSYSHGASLVLLSEHATALTPDTPKHQMVLDVVREIALAAQMPVPTTYIIGDPSPNAFATGRDPAHAVICVTQGLVNDMDREEIQGVIGHEMAHVRDYGIRTMTMIAVLVGGVALLADWLRREVARTHQPVGAGLLRTRAAAADRPMLVRAYRSLLAHWLLSERAQGRRPILSPAARRWSQQGRRPALKPAAGRWSQRGSATARTVIAIVMFIPDALAPIFAKLVALAVSRNREYRADAASVEFTRNPRALLRALEHIAQAEAPLAYASRGIAHLLIVDPLQAAGEDDAGYWANLFATHPPLSRRIARLRAMVG